MKRLTAEMFLILCLAPVILGCGGGSGGGTPEAMAQLAPVVNNFEMPYTEGMTSSCIYNSQPFRADGSWHSQEIMNNSGRTIEIRMVREWHGVSFDGLADFHSQVRRISDGAYVTMFQQDRYSNPSGLIHADTSYGDYPLIIRPGDGLQIAYACNSFRGLDVQGHVTITVWWTWE